MHEIPQLLAEYDRARAYTDELWRDLTAEELHWRPEQNFSPIGWHLGHQAHVAHFMIRNLTAAEPSPAPDLDDLMDSANPEANRLPLPDPRRLAGFRATVGERVHARMNAIGAGDVGAPAQLKIVAQTLLMAIINHEYQHDRWIGEVRNRDLGHALPDDPTSDLITTVDGYLVVCGWTP
ncbi:DinB family protein [Nonomuraea phyllanthi]|uniref:DinB family protein n=1 Tax=Nonomuraea phyllanthi TaxID=2219224 RepID=A0A5C4WLL6_9ACTN|nr:DinB family protein [Nonomuraea phyllanthi]KAB8194955.1 DinB family protein [Nonomuraea phyllanthi]